MRDPGESSPTQPASLPDLVAALFLILIFAILTLHLQTDSLWLDEAYSAALVYDADLPDNLRELPGFMLGSLGDSLRRSSGDVHPPLYFLLLDMWTWLAGESVFALRLPSALFSLIGLAATYSLGKRLLGWRAGLAALLILGTAGLLVYYSREARMYTLLLALAALAMWAYLHWLDRPRPRNVLLYAALLTALLYGHYAGALILLTQGLHLLLSRPRRILRWLIPAGLALLLFAPWLPVIVAQWQIYGQPGAPAFDDAAVALAALVYALTAGYGLLYLIPVLGLPLAIRRQGRALGLLALWLLLTPLALWLGNQIVPALFQPRYTLAILPAAAVLIAGGLTALGDALTLNPSPSGRGTSKLAGLKKLNLGSAGFAALLAAILYTQLTTYAYVWPAKARWDEAVQQAAASRDPLDPALLVIPAHSPAAYYGRQYGLRQGLTVDLGWRWQDAEEMAGYVDSLSAADSLWVMMPSSLVSSWDALGALLATRHVGYRDSVMDMLFYRFDAGPGDGLHFQFGDALAYEGDIGQTLFARPGEDFCFPLALAPLQAESQAYNVHVALTQGYATLRAQAELPIAPDMCLPIPAETPAGPHHLRLSVREDSSGRALPLLENAMVYWGETLLIALVHVGA